MHFQKKTKKQNKTKKIQLHEITKGQNNREKGKNGERYTKWKILTLLEMDTDLDDYCTQKRSYRPSQQNLDTSKPTKPLDK